MNVTPEPTGGLCASGAVDPGVRRDDELSGVTPGPVGEPHATAPHCINASSASSVLRKSSGFVQ